MIRTLLFCSCLLAGHAFGQLRKIPGCTLIETEWADGDSFSVQLPDGTHQTVRLYGVDSIEMHVNGDELMNLPGIGEKTANLIIEARPFHSPDDLTRVSGIGPATLEKVRPFVTATSP